MHRLVTLAGAVLAVSVAACAPAVQRPNAMPMSSSPRASQGMPQSAGGVPPSDVVIAPMTPGAGNGSILGMPAHRGY